MKIYFRAYCLELVMLNLSGNIFFLQTFNPHCIKYNCVTPFFLYILITSFSHYYMYFVARQTSELYVFGSGVKKVEYGWFRIQEKIKIKSCTFLRIIGVYRYFLQLWYSKFKNSILLFQHITVFYTLQHSFFHKNK